MTIIAVRDGMLAADRLVSYDGGRCGYTCKLVEVPAHVGGGYAAASGNMAESQRALGKMAEGRPDDLGNGEFDVIWLLADGSVRNHESGGWFSVEADFQAIGSGHSYALGALWAGASAEAAVEAACDLCLSCGGKIDVVQV